MAWKKVFKRRRRYMRRRAKGSAMSVASRALAKVKQIERRGKPEEKIFDLSELNVNVDYNGYLPAICTPSQGDTYANRSGDSIHITNCTFRYTLVRNGADTPVRVMIVWDKQAKISSSSDLLAAVGAFAQSTRSPKNYDKRFQTEILYDRVHDIDTYHPQISAQVVVPIKKYCTFNIGTTTVTSGRLIAAYFSNVNANTPQINYYSRVSFTDN